MENEISRQIVVVVSGKNYTINFPSVGEFTRIESLKASMTNSQYGSMIFNQTIEAGIALDLVDMMATFSVLIPDLAKDLKPESFLKLDLLDAAELMKVYNQDFLPWYTSLMKLVKEGHKQAKEMKV